MDCPYQDCSVFNAGSIEQIAARVGKTLVFVASRLRLTDLVLAAVEAFYADDIGVGHALLLAKLPQHTK